MGAHAVGLPKIRVRRLRNAGLSHRTPMYEVELTPVGASSPTWRTVTGKAYRQSKPHLGHDEAAMLLQRADDGWTGEVGPWRSMLPEDAESRPPEEPGSSRPPARS